MTSTNAKRIYIARKKEIERKRKRNILFLAVLFMVTIILFTIVICAIGESNEAENDVKDNGQAFPIQTEENNILTEQNHNNAIITKSEETEPVVRYVSIGEYKLTAYCSCEKCCGYWATVRPKDENGNSIVYTASGRVAEVGYTVAADTNILSFGTKVYINGHEYEVQDRGGAIKGNKIDVYFADHQDALNFGVQYAEVFILEE